MFDIAHVVEPL